MEIVVFLLNEWYYNEFETLKTNHDRRQHYENIVLRYQKL